MTAATGPRSLAGRRPPGRPPGGRVLADRSQLLEAAERVLRRDGPDVTMEAVAAEATVTKPIIYRTIGNKEALLEAIAERLVDRINTATGRAFRAASSPRDGVRAIVRAYLDVVEQDRNVYLFVIAGGNGEEGRTEHLADRAAMPLAGVLAQQRVADGLDPAVASTWAYAVVGMLQMTVSWWLRDGTQTADEITDHLTELLWSGLGDTR